MKTTLSVVLVGLVLSFLPVFAVEESGTWWKKARKEAQESGYGIVKLAEAKGLIESRDDILVLDVRPHYEYQMGHIPNSVNLEFHLGDRMKLNQEKRAAYTNLLGADKDRKVLIYCRSYTCLRSAIASRWAVSLGYKNIVRMPLGYQGWQQADQERSLEVEGAKLLTKGDIFPRCHLSLLKPVDDARYLGLKASATSVQLVDIPADYIYVEIYNEHCLGCIEEIKNTTSLFKKINERKQLSKKVKIIGIGAGSKKRNVAKFRKAHDIPFPLFADVDWKLFKCLGSPALPTSYLIKRINADHRQIVLVQRGYIDDVTRLMKRINGLLLQN